MVLSEDYNLGNESRFYPPKICFGGRIVILKDKKLRLVFYDVIRRNFIAQTKFDDVGTYAVIGDNLFFSRARGKKHMFMSLPFSPEARKRDYYFYTQMNSILPNPFTSEADLIPRGAGILSDLTIYPSCKSQLHYAAEHMEEGRISKSMEKGFQFCNDTSNDNIFTLAILRENVKIILEVMKSMGSFSQEKIAEATKLIPFLDVIQQNNIYIESFVKFAMVLARSDRGIIPPVLFKQAEDKIFYTQSS